jgi:predicted DCC family thiol-disulfide oxidoreductase YuxK
MSERPADPGPIVLFDGVCNLCHASVTWMIEHDPKGRLHFASLQSDFGKSLLAGLPSPPTADSIVLVDAAGTHVESDAALRTLAHLGLPWSLASVARILPRALRDGVYRWIARNRYLWFGRQQVCIRPRPELEGRFLDASELRTSNEVPLDTEIRRTVASTSVPRFLHRSLLAYLMLFCFPFPFGAIPGTDLPNDAWESLKRMVVVPAAQLFFGITITVFPGGSGDTTYNYVELFLYVVTALAIALVWHVRARGSSVSPRTNSFAMTWLRFALASILLSYGWIKVFPLQMPPPGPDRLMNPIGETSPMGLLWTFLGAGAAYQVFGGLLEAISGFLLLFRRTTLAGLLLGVPVLTNVVVMNFCFDVPVKIFSSILLLSALVLLVPYLPRAAALLLNLPSEPVTPWPSPWPKAFPPRALAWAKAVFVVLFAFLPGYDAWQNWQTIRATRAAGGLLQGIYRVESFVRDGTPVTADSDTRWLRVGFNRDRVGSIQWASGSAHRFDMEVDKEKRTLSITHRGEKETKTLAYDFLDDGRLRLEGDVEGAHVVAVLRRDETPSVLLSRGFHWINEVPFNR